MADKQVRLARNLVLPLDAVSEKFAILGNPGMGKSATATQLVEQLYRADLPVVVLDIKGDWWGIRSSKDGSKEGLKFVVFGGEHGDLPLEPTAGALIADTIVDYRLSAVLDMSLMSKTKARTFATDFAEQLYQRNRDPLHVVVDEADVLIPQRADAKTARLIGAMEDIAKRGRGRGLGLTIASQRGQEVNQSVLDIMGTVILLGMNGRLTIKAIRDWISVNAANDEVSASEVIGSLPSLEVGEAWFWSPSFMRVVKRVRVNMFTTFDSKATPKAGQRRIVPTKRAEIDLAKLGEEIAATVERAKAADPKALQSQVVTLTRRARELETQVETLRAALDEARNAEPQIVETTVVPDDLLAEIATAAGRAEDAFDAAQLARTAARNARLVAERAATQTAAKHPQPPAKRLPKRPAPAPVPLAPTYDPASPLNRRADSLALIDRGDPDPSLSKAERAVLTALAPYAPNARSAKQVALISGYSSKGGGFRNSLGSLRSKGLIVGANNAMTITDAGLAALGSYEPLPTGSALVEHWCDSGVLGKAESAALRAIVATYPREISAAEVAEIARYEPGGGGFRNALGRLRSLELIVGGNAAMRASDELIDT